MSAKINLLPEVRQAKLHDKQRRQVAISIAVTTVIVTAGVLVLGFLVILGQNLTISRLTSSITNKKGQVAAFPNVKTILSTQARVNALPDLYSQRVYITKLVSILASIQPQDTDFTGVSISGNQLSISAEGKSYMAAARLAKSLEANPDDFTNVQLSSVSLGGHTTGFTVTAIISTGATSGK